MLLGKHTRADDVTTIDRIKTLEPYNPLKSKQDLLKFSEITFTNLINQLTKKKDMVNFALSSPLKY